MTSSSLYYMCNSRQHHPQDHHFYHVPMKNVLSLSLENFYRQLFTLNVLFDEFLFYFLYNFKRHISSSRRMSVGSRLAQTNKPIFVKQIKKKCHMNFG